MNEAIAWYEYQGAGLGLQFAAEIDTYLRRISVSPKQFPETRGEIRRAVLQRFPYTIHFLDETDRIVVLAVFHVKRDPGVLEGR